MQAPTPILFEYLDQTDTSRLSGELKELYELQSLTVSPTLIVPASLEEAYYRLNNLPEQLSQLFKNVDLSNPDEDDIEELEPEAIALFKRHFLLDEMIDNFYEALKPLDSKVTLRRSGHSGRSVIKGRPALIALKNIWAQAWTFDALMERLEQTQSIAVEASAVLIQAALIDNTVAHAQASNILGKSVTLQTDAQGRIARVIS